MTGTKLAKHYNTFTAEERFRLLGAALKRGDDPEINRLRTTGKQVQVAQYDHAPHVEAYESLSRLVFMGLLEYAHKYTDRVLTYDLASEHLETIRIYDEILAEMEKENRETENPTSESIEGGKHAESLDEDSNGKDKLFPDSLIHLFVSAEVLCIQEAGWLLFCERRSLPPYGLTNMLPGFDRLQQSLADAKQDVAEWQDFHKGLGLDYMPPITAEEVAKGLEGAFQQALKAKGGKTQNPTSNDS